MRDICRYAWVCDKALVSKFPGAPYRHSNREKTIVISFSRSMVNWIDGSTEFKCERRRSASFPDTAEMISSTYRFQNKGWTGAGSQSP